MPKTTVRIVMDVEPEVKSALKENADKAGLNLTYYLAYCGLSKEPKAMPPEEIVKAKNLLCEINNKMNLLKLMFKDDSNIFSYTTDIQRFIEAFDRLLLEVQN